MSAALKVRRRTGWPLVGFDTAASGHNPFERRIRRDNAHRLAVHWTFDSESAGLPVGPIHGTPVVDEDGVVFVGDYAGTFFAVRDDGTPLWHVVTDAPNELMNAVFSLDGSALPGTPIVVGGALAAGHPHIVFADANGRVYARDRRSGEELWTARDLVTLPLSGALGNSVTIVNDTVLMATASAEADAWPELYASGVPIPCCAHSGELIALELATGAVRWRRRMIPSLEALPPELAPLTLGPSGASMWSQPSFDASSSTLFVGTGQGYSPAPDGHTAPTTDSIVALDFATGEQRWARQLTADDLWRGDIPTPDPETGRFVNGDVTDSPKPYTLGGRRVVAAGQKDGRFHLLDASTGEVIRSTAYHRPPNTLGAFQTGGAVGDGLVFEHGLEITGEEHFCGNPTCFSGRVLGLALDGSRARWSLTIPGSPLVGGLALANHVLFFQSPIEEESPSQATWSLYEPLPLDDSMQWALYAVDAQNGDVLSRTVFPGRAVGSPVVADGRVYVTMGNVALPFIGFNPAGGIVQLRLQRGRGRER